jgi:hypothetical protein
MVVVITTAEYVQSIAAGIYATALFYTIVTFRRSKRLDQLNMSDRIFSELRELDKELAKIPPESPYDNASKQMYNRIFGTLDYLAFNVNRKTIDDKSLLDYMKPFLISYYEDIFLKQTSVEERDSPYYQEFKKFYLKLKQRSTTANT